MTIRVKSKWIGNKRSHHLNIVLHSHINQPRKKLSHYSRRTQSIKWRKTSRFPTNVWPVSKLILFFLCFGRKILGETKTKSCFTHSSLTSRSSIFRMNSVELEDMVKGIGLRNELGVWVEYKKSCAANKPWPYPWPFFKFKINK